LSLSDDINERMSMVIENLTYWSIGYDSFSYLLYWILCLFV